MANPLVGIIMGSKTDLEVLNGAVEILLEFGIEHEVRVLSAHRTPEQVLEWSSSAESRGLEVLIAGAGGAAHLPGVAAAKTVLPVLGMPVPSTTLGGAAALVAAWPVDLAKAERVVGENHSPFAKMVGGPGEIAGVAHLVGIDEDQIEWRFRLDLAQHLQRGSDMDVRA